MPTELVHLATADAERVIACATCLRRLRAEGPCVCGDMRAVTAITDHPDEPWRGCVVTSRPVAGLATADPLADPSVGTDAFRQPASSGPEDDV